MREVYFHEDEYCQIELLPEANWDFCANQMKEINTFSEQHRADAGWTDMFVRSENSVSISESSIAQDTFVGSLRDLLPPFDRVVTGYSSYTESCTDTIALGQNDNVVVFAEHDAESIITRIWLTLDVYGSDDAFTANRAFRVMSQWPLILVDWGWSVLIRLADSGAVAGYLEARVKAFDEFNRNTGEKEDA